MPALGWLMNLDFAASEKAAFVAVVSQRYNLNGVQSSTHDLIGVQYTPHAIDGVTNANQTLTGA